MSSDGRKTGAVMVVGGGIAGMQAALDLGNAGFKVYLTEESPAIGGRMAQLDKTFPTNDCAMCTISPRLVEVNQHPNVELITCASLQSVDGVPGNFTAKVLQRPRYVDGKKCNACGDCVAVCPVRLPNPFDEKLGPQTAIHKHYPQAIPGTYVISKTGTSPCRIGCPAGVNAHAYVSLIGQRKFAEALDVVRRVLPFPAICGRLCHHPCETECNRGEVDKAVDIRSLKRFISDRARDKGETPPAPAPVTKAEKIAIVGAGPAGLTCALRLREKGYATTIFEASGMPGGMLSSCIPEYRVSAAIANYEMDRILATGIELKTGVRVGKDVGLAALRQEYRSVFIAIGYQEPAKIPLEGSDTKGVFYGIPFLKAAKAGRKPEGFGGKVVVIGGGNVGIDCARSALRLGAKEVSLVCLETRDLDHPDRMPAHSWEIEEAEEEGVRINCCLGPAKVLAADGKVKGLATTKCASVYDYSSGAKKFAPKFTCEAGPALVADTIVIATGQRADTTGFDELEKTPFKTIKADPVTLETSLQGVFAGGDIVRGPASVIEAVAHGNEAAVSIERYLTGADLRAGRGEKPEGVPLPEGKIEKKPRVTIVKEPSAARKNSFVEVEKLLDEESAVAEAGRCLSCALCCECLQCVAACQPKAVVPDMKAEVREIPVGAVILAPGAEMFDAASKGEYGFGRFPNVVTSIQYERILSASGPFGGNISRPSDKGHPKRIAWIQCVGSRDHSIGNDYCSAVCCMYATKQAIITKEHEPGIEVSIFYNDLRSFGKGYEYYTTSARQHGVKYARSIISTIKEIPGTKNLTITCMDESNRPNDEEFDLVVLSVGFTPSKTTKELCQRLALRLNPHGFNAEEEFACGTTNREGIYAAGVFNGPMDIPESVMGASCAAALAGELLAGARNTLTAQKVYPPERDVSGEPPRIGVFICRCGTNIARVVDVQALAAYARTQRDVVFAEENLYTCSTDTQKHIMEMIAEHKLNRVIVSSCTPRTHEPLFQEMLREAGLNKYLFEMANIRDQCSWVHMDLPVEATEKARDLVKMAVGRARYLEPLKELSFDVVSQALVIGGGLSGVTAALSLARQGFMTHLVEKENRLGGNLWNISATIGGAEPAKYLARLLDEVDKEPLLKVYKNAELREISGSIGNYVSKIRCGSAEEEIRHGVVIVATGGVEAKPQSYLYGQNPAVITQLDLERKLGADEPNGMPPGIRNVVMIQCVEARDAEHPYCSRICCTQAVKNALRIKKARPSVNVYVLYRDMMMYGMWECHYRQAREAGVIFIRYEPEKKPRASASPDGSLTVSVFDDLLQKEITLPADWCVLSMPVRRQPDAQTLATALKVPLNAEGFFLEAHLKLRPLDFANEGMFLCGLAHFPKHIEESIAQAKGVAARAATILSKKQMSISGIIAAVNADRCIGCLTCVRGCPFSVPRMVQNSRRLEGAVTDAGVAYVEPSLCHGCGVCASACPRKAIELSHYKDSQLMAKCVLYE